MMPPDQQRPRRILSPEAIEARLVAIEKAQQLAGYSPSPEALDRARRILTGEISDEQAIAEIVAKYRELDPMQVARGGDSGVTKFRSVDEAARAFAAGQLDDDGFITSVVSLPTVRQTAQPDREWWDDWAREHGPMADLVSAFARGLIPATLYDAALDAMARAGHEA